MILEFSNVLTKKSKIGIETERGLGSWVKHMKPTWDDQNMAELKEALINCYKEAEAEEIIEEGEANKMKDFTY